MKIEFDGFLQQFTGKTFTQLKELGKEQVARVTGISFPIFGISWTPPESERSIAKDIVWFLEDRRVLYTDNIPKTALFCYISVDKIREHLSEKGKSLEPKNELRMSISGMRKACRGFQTALEKFYDLDKGQNPYKDIPPDIFYDALQQLRNIFGVELGLLTFKYGLDIDEQLANIIPTNLKEISESRYTTLDMD